MTLDHIISLVSGRLCNEAELKISKEQINVSRLSPLKGSSKGDLCFFFAKEYQTELPLASPGILITGEPFLAPLQGAARAGALPFWTKCAVVVVADPYFAMAQLSAEFEKLLHPKSAPLIDPTAKIAPNVKLGRNLVVGPYCVIEEGAEIGDGSILHSHVVIGKNSTLGAQCELFSHVVIYHDVEVGARVRIHANTVIGSDGFGYAPIRVGGQVTGHQKIYHLGRVVIGDDAELGAGCTIDRATLGETRIGAFAKLDNQVHVAHNAQIEEGAILCASVALAGGAEIGRFAYLGGMTGVVNRIRVGDGSQVGAMTLVTKDIEPAGNAVGNPQRTQKEHFKAHALLNRMLADRKKSGDKK